MLKQGYDASPTALSTSDPDACAVVDVPAGCFDVLPPLRSEDK